MEIILADFKEGVVVPVRRDYDPRALDLEFVDLKYTEPLHLEGTVEKGFDTLTFRGELESRVEQICGRCLKTISQDVEVPFTLYFDIKGKEVLETTDDLRELLILDHPLSFLCREDCRGLCPACGINRNEAPCACVQKETSPRSFSALRNWPPGRRKE